MQEYVIMWLVLAIVLAAVEAATTQFVSIWFAAGCVAAMIFAMVSAPVVLQLLAFVVISAILVAATRPFAKRMADRKTTPTNADRAIGEVALVISDVGGGAVGQVKVGGMVWSAVPASDFVLEKGEKCRVLSIEGVKLIVDKI